MKTFDVQSIAIARPVSQTFGFVAEPGNLPEWTNAFARADATSAELVTPAGTVPIRLTTHVSAEAGTVDWELRFPDGSVAWAYSRVTPEGAGSIYSFVLMAPPVPLEALEGALAQQMEILAHELVTLKSVVEALPLDQAA